VRLADHTFGDASENKSADTLSSMGRHYDEIDAQPGCRLQNLSDRIPSDDEKFITGSGFEFPMGDLFKSGSRDSFRFGERQSRFRCHVERDGVKQIQSRVVLLRKLRRNGNRPKRALIEIHRA